MSSTAVIITIIVCLVALVAYAFVSQTMERKRKQKQRMLAALKQRSKDFKYMISGFPQGFLSKDLNALVHRCLVDVCEQLTNLEPANKTHIDEQALYSKQLEAIKRQPKAVKRTSLDNPQQVKEVKALLQGLNSFVANQQQRGNISVAQYKQYEVQIKQLVIQLTADNYIVNAKQAQGSGKGRLAVHYYTLARKLLAKESAHTDYQKQIAQLDSVIQKLEATITEQEPEQPPPQTSAEAPSEWDEFGKDEEDPWKKKSVYD